jgi:hypothetical protein
VPYNIQDYLSPLALAIWIMDDGEFADPGIKIATHSFSKKDVEKLIFVLKFKYDLNCTVQKISIKNKYNIYIKKDSMNILKNLILPHLHTSMYYKLGFEK